MTKPTAKFLLATLSLLLLSLANTAYGCSCIGQSPCAAYGWAKAVFVGRMIGGTEKNVRQDRNGEPVIYEAGFTRFEVEETFKGVSGKEINIFVDTEKNTSCSWSGYLPGEKYLIFAGEYNGQLSIGPCNPSKRILPQQAEPTNDSFNRRYKLWRADTGLKFLRSLPTTGGRLCFTARMFGNEEDYVRDASITLKGQENSHFESVSGEYGEATIDNIPPGKYAISITWPKGIIGWGQPEVEITERSCIELEVKAFHSGTISGRVLDSQNKTVQEIQVYASSISDQEKILESASSKESGDFEIVNLPAGKYHLYFKTNQEDHLPYFYPGVFDKTKAKEITISVGEKIEDLEFKLPLAIETQTIKGKVVWPDGKPVANASVLLRCPIALEPEKFKIRNPNTAVSTDAEGNFTVSGFRGISYSLKAVVRTGDPNTFNYRDNVHAPLTRLILADEPIEVRLVLTEAGYGPDCDDEKQQRGQN